MVGRKYEIRLTKYGLEPNVEHRTLTNEGRSGKMYEVPRTKYQEEKIVEHMKLESTRIKSCYLILAT